MCINWERLSILSETNQLIIQSSRFLLSEYTRVMLGNNFLSFPDRVNKQRGWYLLVWNRCLYCESFFIHVIGFAACTCVFQPPNLFAPILTHSGALLRITVW